MTPSRHTAKMRKQATREATRNSLSLNFTNSITKSVEEILTDKFSRLVQIYDSKSETGHKNKTVSIELDLYNHTEMHLLNCLFLNRFLEENNMDIKEVRRLAESLDILTKTL